MTRCKATIVFGDDHHDNQTTFRCELPKGHKGLHNERGNMGYGISPMPYTLSWEGSDDVLEKVFNQEDRMRPGDAGRDEEG